MLIYLFTFVAYLALCLFVVLWADISYFQFFQNDFDSRWITRGIMTVALTAITYKYIFNFFFRWFSRSFFNGSFSPLRYKYEAYIVRVVIIGALFGLLAYNIFPAYPTWLGSSPTFLQWALLIIPMLFFSYAVLQLEPGLPYLYARITKGFREHRRRGGYGQGGSGRFQTQLEQYESPYTPGDLFYGEALHSTKSYFLGSDDPRHAILFGGTGGGKGTGLEIPNHLLWPENLISIDPKNTNLHVTGRNPIRGEVFVMDVCHSVEGFEDRKILWNPLADIDPYHPEASALIDEVRDGIILTTSEKEQVWDSFVKQFFKGVVFHVLTAEKYEGCKNLVTVYKLMNLPIDQFQELVKAMLANDRSPMAQAGAAAVTKATGNTLASIQATIAVQFDWLSDPYAQEFLQGDDSGFSVFDLPYKHMSVYITLTGTDLTRHNRIVRMFLKMSLYAMEKPRKPRTRKCLFLMDEFASLGHMDMLEKAATYSRSHGVKLFPVLHSVKQLQEIYGTNWETFLESAAFSAFMSISGEGNLEYIQKKIGTRRSLFEGATQRTRAGQSSPDMTDTSEVRSVMEPKDLERELDPEKGNYLVFPAGKDPMWVKRCDYFDLFDPSMYNKDPHYTGPEDPPPLFGWTATRYWGSTSLILNIKRKGWRATLLPGPSEQQPKAFGVNYRVAYAVALGLFVCSTQVPMLFPSSPQVFSVAAVPSSFQLNSTSKGVSSELQDLLSVTETKAERVFENLSGSMKKRLQTAEIKLQAYWMSEQIKRELSDEETERNLTASLRQVAPIRPPMSREDMDTYLEITEQSEESYMEAQLEKENAYITHLQSMSPADRIVDESAFGKFFWMNAYDKRKNEEWRKKRGLPLLPDDGVIKAQKELKEARAARNGRMPTKLEQARENVLEFLATSDEELLRREAEYLKKAS